MSAEQHKKRLDAWNAQKPKQRIPRHWKTRTAAYYGYDLACQCRTLVLVEGEFDAASIRLALDGLPDIAVCAFGKNIQARLVPFNVLHVILALDMDQAGQGAITSLRDELEARGVTVSLAQPPSGKDWNDCHVQAGLEAIHTAIAQALPENARRAAIISPAVGVRENAGQRNEPPGYENGDVCLLCGKQVEDVDGAFEVDELGDLYCISCWPHRNERCNQISTMPVDNSNQSGQPGGHDDQASDAPEVSPICTICLVPSEMSTTEYIERWERGERPGTVLVQADRAEGEQKARSDQDEAFSQALHRCPKHGRALQYSDTHGGRYCDHVDCWQRYRLIRLGARAGYPALIAIIDPRDYLPDTSATPIRYEAGQPIYPTRKPITKALIGEGEDAWHAYVAGRDYQDIDQAIKALTNGEASISR